MTSSAPKLSTPDLPAKVHGVKNVSWWGMALLILIEITLFSLLITSYFFLKLTNPAWPPEGIDNPSLLLPSINTVILILSGIAMSVGDQAIKKDRKTVLKFSQGTALLLGIVFLVLKWTEYSNLPYDWSTHAYGSITWMMSGFHAAHVISVVLKGLLVFYMALINTYSAKDHVAVEVNGLYWQFVVVIWLPLYFTMYLSPYLF
jgi:cytochrome c oxidase subunit III